MEGAAKKVLSPAELILAELFFPGSLRLGLVLLALIFVLAGVLGLAVLHVLNVLDLQHLQRDPIIDVHDLSGNVLGTALRTATAIAVDGIGGPTALPLLLETIPLTDLRMAETVLALVLRGGGALAEGMRLPVDAAALGLALVHVLVVDDALVEGHMAGGRQLQGLSLSLFLARDGGRCRGRYPWHPRR